MGEVDSTLGCMLLATGINLWLFGLATYQYGSYFRMRNNDKMVLRATVAILCIVDFTHSAIALYTTYFYLITSFGNPAILRKGVHWAIPAVILFINTSSGITHYFFSWRIYHLTRNVYILGLLVAFQLATIAVGFVTGVRALQVGSFEGYVEVSDLLTAWLSLQAGVDLLISMILIQIFRLSRTAFAPTNAVLNRLIRGALQTGAISAAFSIGYLLGFVLAPNRLIWMLLGYCLGRIYSITLMDTLLCRSELKERLNGVVFNDSHQMQPSASHGIRIHTQVEQDTDFEPTTLDRKYAGADDSVMHHPNPDE